jgi:cell division septation protein DedD
MRRAFERGLLLLLILSSLAIAAPDAFTVQVASTSKRDEAERLVAVLAGRDIAAYWTEASVGGKTVYRVRVG